MLETARLLLQPWTPDDAAAFGPIATDPRVLRYINGGEPWSEERIRDWIDRQMQGYADREVCMWKLIEKQSSELIGFCGIQPLDDTGEMEIGWWLAPSRWGRGFATEAARVALRDGIDRVRLDRIVAVAMPENTASINVIKKLGMRFERSAERKGFPVVWYSIEASQPAG